MTANVTPTTRDDLRNLLMNSDDPRGIEQQMMEVMREKIKYTKKNIALLKMQKLRQLEIGTSHIESLARQIENHREKRC
jgi:CRP-like cAMP-binding protein